MDRLRSLRLTDCRQGNPHRPPRWPAQPPPAGTPTQPPPDGSPAQPPPAGTPTQPPPDGSPAQPPPAGTPTQPPPEGALAVSRITLVGYQRLVNLLRLVWVSPLGSIRQFLDLGTKLHGLNLVSDGVILNFEQLRSAEFKNPPQLESLNALDLFDSSEIQLDNFSPELNSNVAQTDSFALSQTNSEEIESPDFSGNPTGLVPFRTFYLLTSYPKFKFYTSANFSKFSSWGLATPSQFVS